MANRMEEEFPRTRWQAGLPLGRGSLPPLPEACVEALVTCGRFAIDLLACQSRLPKPKAQLAYSIGIETLIKRYFSSSRSSGISVRRRSRA
jgi:hypothetical protein